MADAHTRNHSYHLVDPSPWPITGALGALLLTVGMVLWFHDVTFWVFVFGALITGYIMLVWFKDIVNEGEHQGHHTPIVQLGLRYGMVLFMILQELILLHYLMLWVAIVFPNLI